MIFFFRLPVQTHSKSKLVFCISTRMENYKKKSYKRSKEDKVITKSKRCKHDDDSKTPPLPNLSIKELLKERELLRKELNLSTKPPTSTRHTPTSNRHTKPRSKSTHGSNKWKDTKDDNVCNTKKKNYTNRRKESKASVREKSPEYQEYNQLDSEDEEIIIEQIRKQRKQLLEKYKVSDDNRNNHKDVNQLDSKSKTSNKNTSENNNKNEDTNGKPDKQVTDMFSEKDDFDHNSQNEKVNINKESSLQLHDNWDDVEGYYRINIGEVINKKYTIKDTLGQGVFANVVRAQGNQENNTVAIKMIRNNELMYKTGLKEISILKEISSADPENKYHCVKFLEHFLHRGHLCIVLEPLHMDLRCVLKKYGKNHGINLKAIISYSRQLFLALRLLKKIGIIHADVKPDNILVNEKKNVLKLCDFGSAFKINENEPTPYLVSRFYRAPEIILGIPYKCDVDAWSAACTIFEITTGKILFTGASNNKMLKCFMDLKGKIPNKLIKKGKFKDQHFNYNNNFLLHIKDAYNGRERRVEVPNVNITRDLNEELKNSYQNLTNNEESKLTQLKDLLDKMLVLDPGQRLSITDCLKHPFIQDELKK